MEETWHFAHRSVAMLGKLSRFGQRSAPFPVRHEKAQVGLGSSDPGSENPCGQAPATDWIRATGIACFACSENKVILEQPPAATAADSYGGASLRSAGRIW